MNCCLLLALAVSGHSATLQTPPAKSAPKTLADFVSGLQWDPAKRGPLMVLEPDQVRAKKGLDGLAAFSRTRTSLTGLSSIVPDTMVIIDDTMQQSPNMYDGLPRHSKVLYLLTTLTGSQWKSITGSGLGLGDLTNDQKPVFLSLMPKPFKFDTFTVGKAGDPEQFQKGPELSDSERQSIRLHLERTLQFMMPIVGQPNSMSPRDTSHDYGSPGTKGYERDSDADFHKDSFGMHLQQTVPNQLKPSDLDYRSPALNGSIALNPSEKISDLLKRVGQVTGLELHSDLRVSDLRMVSVGQSAPIASVLRTVALAVTGTYRKVRGAYILTSDLVGMGTRKMRLAAFDAALNDKVWNQEIAWHNQIAKSGHLKDIQFREGDQLVPGDALAKKLDVEGDHAKIVSSDLSESLKQFVQRQNNMYKTQQVTADGASVSSSFTYSYVLPTGEMTLPDFDELGQQSLFTYTGERSQEQPQLPPHSKVSAKSFPDPVALNMSADTPEAAQHAVELAARFGFHDLWLDTMSKEALQAATAAGQTSGVKVSLVVMPFDYRGPSDAPFADRTLFGDTPPQSLERRMAEKDWSMDNSRRFWSPETMGPISPLSTGCRQRHDLYVDLSKTPGLSGVRVLNSTPNGYNGPRVEYQSFPSPMFLESGNFGYATELRLGFIREQGIDPIDLCPKNVYTNSDLRQPFFLDDALRGSTSTYDGRDQPNPAMGDMLNNYSKWLAKVNRTVLQSLLDRIAQSKPESILVDAIPMATNALNRVGDGLSPWKPGDPLPESIDGRSGQRPDMSKLFQRMAVTTENMDMVESMLSFVTKRTGQADRLGGMCFDLTRLKPAQMDKFMSESFLPAPTSGSK